MESISKCFSVLSRVSALFEWYSIVVIIGLPILITIVELVKNNYFIKHQKGDSVVLIVFLFIMQEVFCGMVKNIWIYQASFNMMLKMDQRLSIAKMKCSIKIPSENIAEYDEICLNFHKIRQFLQVPILLWETLVSFSLTIGSIGTLTEKISLVLCSIAALVFLTVINDNSLFSKDEYVPNKIRQFGDDNMVHIRCALGGTIDANHMFDREEKRQRQQTLQSIVICCLNIVIIWVAITGDSKQDVMSFRSITWLISRLASSIKDLRYYQFVEDYLTMYANLKKHEYRSSGNRVPNAIQSVEFANASYGYLTNFNNGHFVEKISNFSYIFASNNIYYIEASNGTGKSTLLRMFTHNLISGDVFFGDTHRENLEWITTRASVFHLVQASEYCLKFRKQDTDVVKDLDAYLANGLCINHLFGKSTSEMSGGEKQRMNIYMALVSNATVILLDEVLSEISVEKAPGDEYSFRTRVIDTVVKWPGRANKIILIVGHGVLNEYHSDQISKLRIENSDRTRLISV